MAKKTKTVHSKAEAENLKEFIQSFHETELGEVEAAISEVAGSKSLFEIGATLLADGCELGLNAARTMVREKQVYSGVNRPTIAEIIYQLASNDKAREALVMLTEFGFAATGSKLTVTQRVLTKGGERLTLTKEDLKRARKAINTFDAAFTKEWIKTAEESCVGDGWQPPVPYK